MLIERTDDGRGPFDGLTGKYTIYFSNTKHYILYEKCNDFAGRYGRNASKYYIQQPLHPDLHKQVPAINLTPNNLLPPPAARNVPITPGFTCAPR
jgi:hypothetical protein